MLQNETPRAKPETRRLTAKESEGLAVPLSVHTFFHPQRKTVVCNMSNQRLNGENLILPPKGMESGVFAKCPGSCQSIFKFNAVAERPFWRKLPNKSEKS